jgi:SAM-dependent methyltransferase
MSELRSRLLDVYRENQARLASPALYADPRASWPFYDANYRRFTDSLPRDVRVLEIGSGPGQFLSWMQNEGFADLTGIDSSPGDVEHANASLGRDVVREGDGFELARTHPRSFDLIAMRALLEHIPKDELLPAVDATARALADDGMLIVEVPNMDWLFAAHERYMDLTHEVGFTPESLASLLNLCFGDVRIELSRVASPTRSQRLARPLVVKLLRRLLYVVGEGASDLSFASRTIIAVAKRPLVGR